jgi:hypothetical protein
MPLNNRAAALETRPAPEKVRSGTTNTPRDNLSPQLPQPAFASPETGSPESTDTGRAAR